MLTFPPLGLCLTLAIEPIFDWALWLRGETTGSFLFRGDSVPGRYEIKYWWVINDEEILIHQKSDSGIL